MKEEQTYSWIFLATALASQTEPADFNGISMVADGINHSVPTHKEIQTSISWLSLHGLISKQRKKYSLTSKGHTEYEKASGKTKTLFKIWENLEEQIKNMSNVRHNLE